MLEVLDPEQNFAFSDHYLDSLFDLSKVMFYHHANSLGSIPAPLLDRMKLSNPWLHREEKMEIANRYLIPRQIEENGITPLAWRSRLLHCSALSVSTPTKQVGVIWSARSDASVASGAHESGSEKYPHVIALR